MRPMLGLYDFYEGAQERFATVVRRSLNPGQLVMKICFDATVGIDMTLQYYTPVTHKIFFESFANTSLGYGPQGTQELSFHIAEKH